MAIIEEVVKDLPWLIQTWLKFRGGAADGPDLLGPITITDLPRQGNLPLTPLEIASRMVDTEDLQRG